MGFDGRWVNLVMDCVSSVSYSFVINGDVCGAVTPTRGLRQGDPISPYLFILVADAFSSLLQNKVRERKLHGAKASRKGPEISHLLFADDSLLFTRANRQECQTIVDVLNQYEQASGQKINYEKSEVSFSKGVESKLREDLMHILNMRQVDRHERYLGIPTIVGRSRKAVFGALIDRIWKKLQGWKEKLLSRAGKEILLKSVIQAIPTYLMGVYKIPHSVTDRIHSAMARFLWGSSDGKQKTHWRSWKSTCTLKCLGGMGFRDMNVFNDALLGRQAWRLTKAPNSLLGRVLKAKYYPNNEFLDSSLRLAGSYSWRSIWSSKALVREGVIWRVGDGRSIKLWDDPWIADSKGRFLSSTAIPNLQWVSGIIDKEKRDWRNDNIDGYFNARDRRSILAIPISESDQKDELCWAFSMTGNYTVKSAYMLGKGGDFDTFHQAWVELWKANVIPKVKHFFWRLCTGTLPTRSLLLHRHMIEDAQCSWCGATLETPAHALVDCPRVKDLWSKCKCDQMADWSSYTSICELVASWKSLDSKVKQRGMFLAWCIWGERNRKVFENKISRVKHKLRNMEKLIIFLTVLFFLSSFTSAKISVFNEFQADNPIEAFNLFPKRPVNIINSSDNGDLSHSSSKIVEKRFKFPNFYDPSGATVEELGHHAGYYQIQHSHNARMFYFFFESRNRKEDPVVIWLTGGPGCSSELALFYENGPFKIANNLSLVWNEYGWDQAANLIFVDQPIGTGFSYSTDRHDIRHDESGVSNDLYDFLQAFFTKHPSFAKNDFYITGESYAGHYIPAFAACVHSKNKAKKGIHINLKGFAIGNGLTDPAVQYEAYPDYALEMGLIKKSSYNVITKMVPLCETAVKLCGTKGTVSCMTSYLLCNTIFTSIRLLIGDTNYYDIRKKCEGRLCYDFSNMEKFLNQESVRSALGVGDIEFQSCSTTVYQALLVDWMRNLEVGIPALLEDGIQLLVYAGEYDLICNWLGNSRWVHAMEWSAQQDFVASPEIPFEVDGSEAGILKSLGPLSFLKVHDAGHMVPMDQPKAALEMLRRWTKGSLLLSTSTPQTFVASQ